MMLDISIRRARNGSVLPGQANRRGCCEYLSFPAEVRIPNGERKYTDKKLRTVVVGGRQSVVGSHLTLLTHSGVGGMYSLALKAARLPTTKRKRPKVISLRNSLRGIL